MCQSFFSLYFVKGKSTVRYPVTDFAMEVQQMYKDGKDPFQYDFNHMDRKFGNSREYRSVEAATLQMFGLIQEEVQQALLKEYKN